MSMIYGSYDELRQARSRASMRSASAASLMLSQSGSHSSLSSKSSNWEDHVRKTILRNERIRLQNEATKLRSAFVSHDQRLTGSIPSYMLAACLKAGGSQLPRSEMQMINQRFMTSDGQFAWLRFCESLEKGKGAENFHPRRVGGSRPMTAMTPEQHLRGGSVSSKFLVAKASRASLTQSASAASLLSSAAGGSTKADRMRKMVSEASLAAEATQAAIKAKREAKLRQVAEWIDRHEAKKRPSTTPIGVGRGSHANLPQPVEYEESVYEEPVYAPPPPKVDIHEDFAKRQKLKQFLAMAEEGLNSRFSDMFKAFQYVDLDRSGRLSKQEISRALDLWNVPMEDDILDLLLSDCDQDGDGGVSYEEFVDKLARGTVAPAAMGKRGMQSKEAMGVDAQEHLNAQLGHQKEKAFVPTINKQSSVVHQKQ